MNYKNIILIASALIALIAIILLSPLASIQEKFARDCRGKRDGVSGCRRCCRGDSLCLTECMNY